MGDASGDGRMHTDPDDTIDAGSGAGRGDAPLDKRFAPDYPELVQVERRHYVIGREIAKGGMGRVLEARDLRLGRDVAIKELLPKNRDAARRFEREARITARLQHPGIIHVYEAGVWSGGEPFYAMPIVAGRSLDKVVAERTTLEDRLALLPVVIAVADALAYAHSENVVHRDLKPANVLVGEFGQTVVIDWGLAKDLGTVTDPRESMAMRVRERDAIEATMSGSVVGTPAYMPPEQARGDNVDQRADVYAIGALLYKTLTGKTPYEGETAGEIVERVKAGPPRAISELEPGLPRELVAIADKAMARHPDHRYITAGELAQDLKRFETGQLVAAHRYTPVQLVLRWLRRHRILVGTAILVLGIAGYSFARVVAAKQLAEAQRRNLLEEKGRTELVVLHHAGAALANLAGAAADGAHSGALGFLIADAKRPFAAQLARLAAGRGGVLVAASSDGKLVATAADVVKLWTRDGALVRELGRVPHVSTLAFDPTGQRLVAGGDDGARLWPVAGGDPVLLAATEVTDAAWSGDGTQLATAHADGIAHVWDAATAHEFAEVNCHAAALTSVRFSPDGLSLVTASQDGTAFVWRSTDDELVPLRGHTKPVQSARWSHDGKLVITASDDGTARVWNAERGKLVVQPMQHDRGGVAIAELSGDDSHVLTAGDDHVVRLWQLPDVIPPNLPDDFKPRAPRLELRMAGHTDTISTAAFGRDDELIATGAQDSSVRLWDATTGQEIAWFEHAGVVGSLAFVPGAELRVVAGSGDGTARIWKLPRATTRDLESPVHAIAVARGWVATATADARVTVWRDAEARVLADHKAPVYAVAFTPDGTRLVSGGADPVLYIWDPMQSQRVGELGEPGGVVRALAISPDGTTVAAVAGGVVHRWSLATRRALGTLAARDFGIDVIAYAPHGQDLVAGSASGGLALCDERECRPSEIERGPVTALAFSGDGAALVVAGRGTVRIYELSSGKLALRLALEGPTGEVRAVAFTADGTRVITASDDGVARVWDAYKGKLLGTRGARSKGLTSLAVTAQDELWIAGADGTVGAWNVGTDRGDAGELDRFMRDLVPWRLDANDVVVRTNEGGFDGQRRTDGQ